MWLSAVRLGSVKMRPAVQSRGLISSAAWPEVAGGYVLDCRKRVCPPCRKMPAAQGASELGGVAGDPVATWWLNKMAPSASGPFKDFLGDLHGDSEGQCPPELRTMSLSGPPEVPTSPDGLVLQVPSGEWPQPVPRASVQGAPCSAGRPPRAEPLLSWCGACVLQGSGRPQGTLGDRPAGPSVPRRQD